MAGWFVVNVADATARSHERGGVAVTFEDPEDRFPDFAINIRVLEPGQPNGVYHSEPRVHAGPRGLTAAGLTSRIGPLRSILVAIDAIAGAHPKPFRGDL
jgi:hypothetical protein